MIKNSTGKHGKRERRRAGTVNGGWSGWLRISSLLYVFIDSLFVAFEAKTCFPLWVRQRRSHTGRPFFVKFDRVNNNIGHYIIWYLQGLCDNRLVAWLAWCKVLLAEFLYRYGVWQHSVLRERWGCWIKVMQTDRVSWNMKPGRWNLSEKKKKWVYCACLRVSTHGRRRRRRWRWSTKTVMGDSDETQAQKPGEENVKCCAECKPVKREKKTHSFLKEK